MSSRGMWVSTFAIFSSFTSFSPTRELARDSLLLFADSHHSQGGEAMLVLSRKPSEAIVINNNIRITVVSVKNGQVRLGIEAPADVTVGREEIHRRRIEFIEVD